jgi:hypothetical protein
MPGEGLTHGPPANKKRRRQSPQVQPNHPALTLMACSPREPGFLAPVVRSVRHASELGLSVGRPGPHAFASASAPFVRTNESRASPKRPSHPALHVS